MYTEQFLYKFKEKYDEVNNVDIEEILQYPCIDYEVTKTIIAGLLVLTDFIKYKEETK